MELSAALTDEGNGGARLMRCRVTRTEAEPYPRHEASKMLVVHRDLSSILRKA